MRGWLDASRGHLDSAVETLGPILAGATRSCGYGPLWPCWMGLFYEVGELAGAEDLIHETVDVAELIAERNPGIAVFEGIALNLRGRSKDVWVPRTVSPPLNSTFPRVDPQHHRRVPAQHDHQVWPYDSGT